MIFKLSISFPFPYIREMSIYDLLKGYCLERRIMNKEARKLLMDLGRRKIISWLEDLIGYIISQYGPGFSRINRSTLFIDRDRSNLVINIVTVDKFFYYLIIGPEEWSILTPGNGNSGKVYTGTIKEWRRKNHEKRKI